MEFTVLCLGPHSLVPLEIRQSISLKKVPLNIPRADVISATRSISTLQSCHGPIVLALLMLLLVVLHCQGGPFVLQMTKGSLLHDWHHEPAL
jgi:hypothetical protein